MNKLLKKSEKKIILSYLETIRRRYINKDIKYFKIICADYQEIAKKRRKELENQIKVYPNLSDAITKGRVLDDSFVDDYTHYLFSTVIYHSLIVSIFSYFETQLKIICDVAQKLYNQKIKPEDLKGESDIDGYRKYLDLIINLESASNKLKIWQTINYYRKLRNLIVHHNSNVKKGESKLYQYIINETEISLNEKTGFFHIDKPSYIDKFCDDIKDYLCYLVDELKNK